MRTISRAASHAADRAQRGGAIVVESEAIIGVVRAYGAQRNSPANLPPIFS
jgi:hypothetical protein